MEIPFASDVQAQLLSLASQTGQTPERVVERMITEQLSHDEWFRASVAKGFASLEQGDFVTQGEVEARIARVLNG